MKYREMLRQGEAKLRDAGVPEPEVDAWILFSHITGLSKTRYYMVSEDEVDSGTIRTYETLIRRRCTREPLQYITGSQEFMGYNFEVNPSVLIPRQDTETLVEETLKIIDDTDTVLDMCTGSGCIITSLKKLRPTITATAVDTSADALAVARHNAFLNEVEVSFIQSDLFANVEGTYDVIVSNPPYIPTTVVDQLMPEVRDYEPGLALDGNEDGLLFYRRICADVKSYLKGKSYLLFEIGFDQGKDVSTIMNSVGFHDIRVIQDYAPSDRVVMGHL